MSVPRQKNYTEKDYYNLPEGVRAELIDGQFYDLASPSRLHQTILGELHLVIGNYLKKKGGSCRIYPAPFAVKLFNDEKTIVEPDISVIRDPAKLTDKGCTGAPDWIIEIVSPSNPGSDYVRKLNLYAAAGVREYWVVDPKNSAVLVCLLENSVYSTYSYTFDDTVPSGICGDFDIDFTKLALS